MPVQGQGHPFTARGIAEAPHEAGVFILWDREEAIYIGRTGATLTTIHAAIADHSAGAYGNCTQFATHFTFEVLAQPAPREQALMEEFGSQNGRLPRCQTVARQRR